MKVTILGCGASAGVPLVGCDCKVCTSDNPKNNRTRVSVMVEQGDTRILIDTSPDLRQQLLRENIKMVDAILYTHDHADHCHGIDDIRSLNYHRGEAIDAYADSHTLKQLQIRFAYVFRDPIPEYGWFRPCLIGHSFEIGKAFEVGEMKIIPFMQDHGRSHSIGFRIGDFVYSTDVKSFPEESQPHLKGIKLWVLDCLTDERPMPTHADLSLALKWVEKYQPDHTVVTHLSHALEYESLNATTPNNVEVAYDGLVLEL